jgi:hypothetical protein
VEAAAAAAAAAAAGAAAEEVAAAEEAAAAAAALDRCSSACLPTVVCPPPPPLPAPKQQPAYSVDLTFRTDKRPFTTTWPADVVASICATLDGTGPANGAATAPAAKSVAAA